MQTSKKRRVNKNRIASTVLLLGIVLFLIQFSFAQSVKDIQLITVPNTVYKIKDPTRTKNESWYFNLVVQDKQNRRHIRPLKVIIELLSGKILVEKKELYSSTLKMMQQTSYKITSKTHPLSLKHKFSLKEVFDFRFGFNAKPIKWNVNNMRITLKLKVPNLGKITKVLAIPLKTYKQKTKLIFPMRGKGIITQGQINNFGHSGHANQFAVDVMGLNSEYGPMVKGGKGNAVFAGWGREIIAPASGKVIYVRNDVPENRQGTSPSDIYSKVPNPIMAIAGNCVIIDHENGEFSALMHMQNRSIKVKIGNVVKQGQPIGLMGNSGDSFGVHLHYQLQNGPELFQANSLPVKFENLSRTDLVRGVYFDAK